MKTKLEERAPGLFVRTDTPKHVNVNSKFVDVITRGQSPSYRETVRVAVKGDRAIRRVRPHSERAASGLKRFWTDRVLRITRKER